jgi:predicted hydrolase (HD superfamily)
MDDRTTGRVGWLAGRSDSEIDDRRSTRRRGEARRKEPRVNIDQARELMHEWVTNDALRIHMECVAVCCAAYARELAPDDVERWTVTGILHDFDYERHPTGEEHPAVGVKHLEELGVDADIRAAIMGHAEHTGVPRESQMAKVLFAVDELAGFIVACCKVRPNGIADLPVKSVKKKLKDKAFAAAVNRAEINNGIEQLGVDRDEHIQKMIDALRAEADRLGI